MLGVMSSGPQLAPLFANHPIMGLLEALLEPDRYSEWHPPPPRPTQPAQENLWVSAGPERPPAGLIFVEGEEVEQYSIKSKKD